MVFSKETENTTILFISIMIGSAVRLDADDFSKIKVSHAAEPHIQFLIFLCLKFKDSLKISASFSLQESLCVLNITKNNIDELLDLAALKQLTHLYAADNQLEDIQVLLRFTRFSKQTSSN